MCKYCKDMKNSDDVLPLELSSCEIGDVMGRGMSVVLGMNCYKHGKTGRYQIFSDFRVDGADLDAVTSINIRYCPMCGRKLTEENEVEMKPVIHAHAIIDWLGNPKCSNCGDIGINATEPYCQHCGARLDETEELTAAMGD